MNETELPGQFDALLEHLKRTRGFDFAAYKRPSLTRRIRKRLEALALHNFDDYTDYLQVHPDEFARLFDAILINVTSFFRDPAPWEFLRDVVLPQMLSALQPGDPVRVWSAGCASGEETYSVAMLLAEALGREQFRDRVKIYATDVDDHALGMARIGAYTEADVENVPVALRDKYFTRENDRCLFDKDLRRSVIFGRHDLIQDAPISRVNLLICRNALMYFHTEAQARILARFHFALVESGVLFLGKAEMLLTHSQLFVPLDLRVRMFRKVNRDGWRDRMTLPGRAQLDEPANHDTTSLAPMVAAAFEIGPHAQIVVNGSGRLALCNERARALFNVAPSDIGRSLQDLELSYKPLELRSLIDQARDLRRPVLLKEIEWGMTGGREPRVFDVVVAPVIDGDGQVKGVSVSFTDVSRVQELQAQLNRFKQDLETASEELQSTNEELETTNEELQSTVEELETTNEELQSTNEELETMNEELQSTNEELHTTNEELNKTSDDLNRTNAFLESVLTGVRSGVIVLDRELSVTAWNHRSEDFWGLRSAEAQGQNFLNLDIGLPTEMLRTAVREILSGESEFAETALTATNRRGRTIDCRVIVTPLRTGTSDIRGAILLIDEQPPGEAPAEASALQHRR